MALHPGNRLSNALPDLLQTFRKGEAPSWPILSGWQTTNPQLDAKKLQLHLHYSALCHLTAINTL